MAQQFIPPPLSSHEGQDKTFTPPPPVEDQEKLGMAPPPQPGFLDSLYNTVQGPRDFSNGITNLVTSPIKTLDAMGQQSLDMAGKALQDFRQGNYLSGARRTLNAGLNAIVPGLGAASDDAGDELAKGNYAAGIGKSLGAGANAAALALAPRVVPAALKGISETITPDAMADRLGMARTTGPIGRALTVDPRVAMTRALRPPPSDAAFSAPIPQTLARIRAANNGLVPGGVTNGQLDLIPATRGAIKTTQAGLDPWMNRASSAGVRISGNPIVQATRDATSGMLPSEAESAQGLIDRAQADYGTDFEPGELRNRLKLLNQRISTFENKSGAAQSSALADIPVAVLKAQRDAAADTLYRGLDPTGAGAGPRFIQSQTGDLINLRDAMLRRNNAIVAEQPLSPFGRAMAPIKRFAQDIMPARGTGLAFADASEGRTLPLIQRSFKAVKNQSVWNLPKPESPLYPTASGEKLLGPGTLQIPQTGTEVPYAPGYRSNATELQPAPMAPATREIRTGRLLGPGTPLPPPTELPSGGFKMNVETGAPLKPLGPESGGGAFADALKRARGVKSSPIQGTEPGYITDPLTGGRIPLIRRTP